MNRKRRESAVRMLEHSVRLALPKDESSMSDMANGRLASSLLKDVRLLKRSARDGPQEFFWESLHKAIFKLVKFIRQTRL